MTFSDFTGIQKSIRTGQMNETYQWLYLSGNSLYGGAAEMCLYSTRSDPVHLDTPTYAFRAFGMYIYASEIAETFDN